MSVIFAWRSVLIMAPILICAAVTSWFVWTRGGRAERIAIVGYSSSWIYSYSCLFAFFALTGDPRPPWPCAMIGDAYPATIFLWLALRYDNLWYASAAAAQGFQMGVHIMLFMLRETGTALSLGLALMAASMSYTMMGSMIGATVSHLRRSVANDLARAV